MSIIFFTGMFDFSDEGKKSTLVGIQHQNENLYKDTFLGTLSPVTGFLVTEMPQHIYIQVFKQNII